MKVYTMSGPSVTSGFIALKLHGNEFEQERAAQKRHNSSYFKAVPQI
jgi:hypothetical protein